MVLGELIFLASFVIFNINLRIVFKAGTLRFKSDRFDAQIFP